MTKVCVPGKSTLSSKHSSSTSFRSVGDEEAGDAVWRTASRGYSADAVRQKFTGHERDSETGLDYMKARYYSSAQGRFVGVDPSGKSIIPTNPQTWNKYAYCYNNPLKLVDRNGKWPTGTHERILERAFPKLNKQLLERMQKGSESVDRDGVNPKTLWEKNAPQHAMTPGEAVRKFGGNVEKAREWARNEASIFINDRMDSASRSMNTARGVSLDQPNSQMKSLEQARREDAVLTAMFSFGQGAHTIMDGASPAHRDFQAYDVSPFQMIGVANPGGAAALFIVSMAVHSCNEGGEGCDREPTDEEMNQMVNIIRDRFRQAFGEAWYDHAVNGKELPKEASSFAGR